MLVREIIVNVMRNQPNIEIVAQVSNRERLEPMLQRTRPDVLILFSPAAQNGFAYNDLLFEHARMKVLDISTDGRLAHLHELRPRHTPLGELSPAGLLAAVQFTG